MFSIRKAAGIGLAAAGLVLVGLAPSWPQAATPAAPPTPAEGAPSQPGDPFGEEVMMTPKPIVYLKGTATWDSAYDSIVDAFRSVRGFIDVMDTIYDAITNSLDQKGLDAKDLFIEQYVTDPVTTPEDKLVIEVFVPVK